MKTLMLIPLIAVLVGCNSGGGNSHASEPQKTCQDYVTVTWDNNSFEAFPNTCNDIKAGTFTDGTHTELSTVTTTFGFDTIQSFYTNGEFDYAVRTDLRDRTLNIYWSDNKQCYGPKDNDVIVCDLSYDLDYTDTLARVNDVLGL